jgi:hypothetical protein
MDEQKIEKIQFNELGEEFKKVKLAVVSTIEKTSLKKKLIAGVAGIALVGLSLYKVSK